MRAKFSVIRALYVLGLCSLLSLTAFAVTPDQLSKASVEGIFIGMTRSEVVARLGEPPQEHQHSAEGDVWRYPGKSGETKMFLIFFDLKTAKVRGIASDSVRLPDGSDFGPASIIALREELGQESTSWKSGEDGEVLDYLWEFGTLRLRAQVDRQGKLWRYTVFQGPEIVSRP